MMMRGTAATLAIAMLALGAAACGGVSEEEKREEARQERAAKKRAQERRAHDRQQAAYETCTAAFSEFQDAVEEMNSRLSVGLSYSDYSTNVADVRVAYDQADYDALDDIDCIGSVGVPLEGALNQYVKAANIWDDCFEDIYCENDSIDPELQSHWEKAGRLATRASKGLAAMEPAPLE
jgi:hypothetical protein